MSKPSRSGRSNPRDGGEAIALPPPRSPRSRKPILAISLVCLVIGIATFAVGFARQFTEARATAGWIATPCTILRSGLTSRPVDPNLPPKPRRVPTYQIDVAYRYAVGGAIYHGTRLTVAAGGDNDWSVDGMRRTVASLPEGSAQTCYVDPADPARSVLQPGVPISTWAAGVASGLFIVAGLVGMVYARVRRRS